RLRRGGPRPVQPPLLSPPPETPRSLYAAGGGRGGGAVYRDRREVRQALAAGEGQRWRWFVGSQGRVVEAAPGDVHGLRRAAPVALTITWYSLPDRESVGRVRNALRAIGATCTRGPAG
ncbi:hypothetical protein GAY28_24795, partial [Azospirillum brasilense]|nr:hypothetical protein [Azospirillum brasilense]